MRALKNPKNLSYKFLFIFLCLSPVSLNASVFTVRNKTPNSVYLQKSLTNIFKPSGLEKELNLFLAKTYPGRFYQQSGGARVKKFLKEWGDKNNVSFLEQTFSPDTNWALQNIKREFNKKIEGTFPVSSPTYQKWFRFLRHIQGHYSQMKGKKFSNFLYQKEGENKNKTLVISTNYDSVNQDQKTKFLKGDAASIGALDNASSFISLLELIKIIEHIDLPFNVIVAFFDLQELGNLGARAFIQEALDHSKGKEVIHVNTLMIGKTHASKKKNDFTIYGTQSWSGALKSSFAAIPQAKINFKKESFPSSDAGPFLDVGISSLTLMGLPESEHEKINHQDRDSIENIDFYSHTVGSKLLTSLVFDLLYPL